MKLSPATDPSADYPKPFIVPPLSGKHEQSFIILHGGGDNGEYFGQELIKTTIPGQGDLRSAFPDAKLLCPTAPKRPARFLNGELNNQWFDFGAHFDPNEEEALEQYEGLSESVSFVHQLLHKATEEVGAENVVLWGLSQGCATALVSTLLWEGKPFAAVVGMCGWLPWLYRMEALSAPIQWNGDINSKSDTTEEGRSSIQLEQGISWLRERLNAPAPSRGRGDYGKTPVFLGHGAEDDKLPVAVGEAAASFLRRGGFAVQWESYDGLEHCFSGEMLDDIVRFLKERLGQE